MDHRQHLRRPTILIVDDDDIFVELLTDELSPHFTVEWARDGCTALSAVRDRTPDAVFLDQGLPDISGVRLIDALRTEGCESPVIMLTASRDVRIAAAAMRAGAVDFVVKDAADGFYDDIVPAATRAVEKWTNEKELEYLRELEEDRVRRATALNEELKRKNEQLEAANAAIAASQQQLQKKNLRLSELYATAHRFVDNVSHEMRTPLTVVKEFSSIILDGLAGAVSEQQAEYLNIILAKTNDLARMVDDMLDISKIEAGLLRVDRGRCRFGDIVGGVRDVLEQKARSSQMILHFEERGELPELFCDKEKAGRVLINLVVNATKFSEPGSDIRIWAQPGDDPQEVLVGVSDCGPGIAPENLTLIFERFRQVDGALRSSTKGFGLGLNIVKELVYLNLGEVHVESEPGRGSTFSFTLPAFDYRSLVLRLLARSDTVDCHGDHLAMIRVTAANPAPNLCSHLKSFVVHHLTAFDMAFERAGQQDVVLLALTNNAAAMVERLHRMNREEMRMSPGSCFEMHFGIVQFWDAGGDPAVIADQAVALINQETEVASGGASQAAHH